MENDWIKEKSSIQDIRYFRNPKNEKLYEYVGLYIFDFKSFTSFRVVVADKFSNCLLYKIISSYSEYKSFQNLITSYKTTYILKGNNLFDIFPNLCLKLNFNNLDLKFYSIDYLNPTKRNMFEISSLVECFPEYNINNPVHIATTFVRLFLISKRLKPPFLNLVKTIQNAEVDLKIFFEERRKDEKKWKIENAKMRFENLPLAEQQEWGREFDFEDNYQDFDIL